MLRNFIYLISLNLCNVFCNEIDHNLLKIKIFDYSQKGSWARNSIENDLSSWNNEDLSAEKIKKLTIVDTIINNYCSLIEVKNNSIKITPLERTGLSPQEVILKNSLELISKVVPLDDVTILTSYHDRFNFEFPVLSYSKSLGKKSILIPDFEALSGYKEIRDKTLIASQRTPWNKKKNQIFWRGSLTGITYNKSNYLFSPRSRVVSFSNLFPDIIDAKFIRLGQVDDETLSIMQDKNLIGNPVSIEESIKYKFLLDVDGNSSCFSRTYWTLLSNSLVFKVKSENIQWYYDLLRPEENFIQINEDLTNIQDKFSFYLENQNLAQIISKNATDLVLNELSKEANLAYLYLVIKLISQIQNP